MTPRPWSVLGRRVRNENAGRVEAKVTNQNALAR